VTTKSLTNLFCHVRWITDSGYCGDAALGFWLQATVTSHSGARLTTGWLIKLLTSFAQPARLNLNRWLGAGGQRCGHIELTAYLAKGPVPLVLDLRIAHERWGSSSDPSLKGHLHYPNDLDGPLNEAAADKIRQYRADYNNRPSNAISFMTAIASTSGHLQ
jgi:hypothetical protein